MQPTLSRGSTHVSSSERTRSTPLEAEHSEGAQISPNETNVAHHERGPPTMAQQLQELREWRQRALDEQELRHLQEIKRRFEQGDTSALTEGVLPAPRVEETLHEPNAGAPRPEKPTQFTNRDRAEFNCWARDCEATFRGSPKTFQTDAIKIDFGLRYITDPLRSTWDAYTHDQQRKDSAWEPSWENLKTVMVDSLGPPEQRKLVAHRALKQVRQDWSQDPNDLLAKLDTLWTELGDSYPEEQRIMDFVGALTPTIQKELLLLDPAQRSTLTDVNSRARLIWDRTRKDTPKASRSGGSRGNRPHSPPKNEGGNEKTWKRPRRETPDRRQDRNFNKVWRRDARSNITCFNCKEPGHIARDCEKAQANNPRPSETTPGKGRGRRA